MARKVFGDSLSGNKERAIRNMFISGGALLLVALLIGARVAYLRYSFSRAVSSSKATLDGYDARFIGMVNRLEQELAVRASFGYPGGKDPFTGRKRLVVQPVILKKSVKQTTGTNQPVPKDNDEIDSVRLTAIISGSDPHQFTAIIMVGERSFSVVEDDRIGNRTVEKITSDMLYIEDDSNKYEYSIKGERRKIPKKQLSFPLPDYLK